MTRSDDAGAEKKYLASLRGPKCPRSVMVNMPSQAGGVKLRKLYLMTTSCSGKSHFTQLHPHHCGLRIVDFTKVNRMAARGREPEASMAPGAAYGQRAINFLEGQSEPIALLGRRGPADPPKSSGITYAAILIPVDDHIRNWKHRKKHKPSTRWQTFSDLDAKREKLRRYAQEYNIDLFSSFADAIEELTTDEVD